MLALMGAPQTSLLCIGSSEVGINFEPQTELSVPRFLGEEEHVFIRAFHTFRTANLTSQLLRTARRRGVLTSSL